MTVSHCIGPQLRYNKLPQTYCPIALVGQESGHSLAGLSGSVFPEATVKVLAVLWFSFGVWGLLSSSFTLLAELSSLQL